MKKTQEERWKEQKDKSKSKEEDKKYVYTKAVPTPEEQWRQWDVD